jgi:hypothetical protein
MENLNNANCRIMVDFIEGRFEYVLGISVLKTLILTVAMPIRMTAVKMCATCMCGASDRKYYCIF